MYATLSYDRELGGVLSSFQYLFVKDDEFSLDITLTCSENLRNVICLPEYENIPAETEGKTLRATIDHTGIFTFLVNDDSQENAVTLFVRKYRDEDAEIAEYIRQYGKENVTVYEPGRYDLSELSLENSVIYFRRGSYIHAGHLADVTCAGDEGKAGDFMYLNGCEDTVITGMGTVDFNSLDWHERTHCILRWSKNVRIDGLLFLNPSSWTFSTYGCENCEIRDIAVFGYRTNSDGINICGCSNIKISGCFCRNGDDCFSVKTTNDVYEAENIMFTDCIGWSNKARCFGITGEVYRKISDVEFSHCAVIYRNAVWDNDRVCSLSVMNECGGQDVENVTFSGIEIYHDSGRPFNVLITDPEAENCCMKDILFENIVCSGAEKSRIATRTDLSFSEKLLERINVFLIQKGLTRLKLIGAVSSLIEKNLRDTNRIYVTADNVVINGKNYRSGRDSSAEGNVFLTEK